jgi:aminomethyltransferase
MAAVQMLCSNDASKLQPGQAQYSALLTDQGTFVDDLVVYRLRSDHFLLVVNAANIVKDYTWIAERIGVCGDAVVMDASSRYALLSVQGPAAAVVVQPLTGVDLSSLAYYSFAHGEVANVRGTISRTGYTGEDGFEIFVPPQQADRVWQALLTSDSAPVVPCGLGARDTLRLEAGLRLYGNDMDETTTALEAGLGWIVGWNKGSFVGVDALRVQKASGASRRLAGFELTEPGIARQGYDVYAGGATPGNGRPSGKVTSGTQTPTLKKSIGMAYLPQADTAPGREFEVDIRGRRTRARVVPMPFYKRPKP